MSKPYTLKYCLDLAEAAPGGTKDPSFPEKCLLVIERARRSNLLYKRNSSRKQKVWQPETGHGKRQVWGDPLVPHKHDNVKKEDAKTTEDLYLSGKSEAARNKIKLLRARSKARGATNMGDVNVDEDEVHRQRQRHLKKRATNRVNRWGK